MQAAKDFSDRLVVSAWAGFKAAKALAISSQALEPTVSISEAPRISDARRHQVDEVHSVTDSHSLDAGIQLTGVMSAARRRQQQHSPRDSIETRDPIYDDQPPARRSGRKPGQPNFLPQNTLSRSTGQLQFTSGRRHAPSKSSPVASHSAKRSLEGNSSLDVDPSKRRRVEDRRKSLAGSSDQPITIVDETSSQKLSSDVNGRRRAKSEDVEVLSSGSGALQLRTNGEPHFSTPPIAQPMHRSQHSDRRQSRVYKAAVSAPDSTLDIVLGSHRISRPFEMSAERKSEAVVDNAGKSQMQHVSPHVVIEQPRTMNSKGPQNHEKHTHAVNGGSDRKRPQTLSPVSPVRTSKRQRRNSATALALQEAVTLSHDSVPANMRKTHHFVDHSDISVENDVDELQGDESPSDFRKEFKTSSPSKQGHRPASTAPAAMSDKDETRKLDIPSCHTRQKNQLGLKVFVSSFHTEAKDILLRYDSSISDFIVSANSSPSIIAFEMQIESALRLHHSSECPSIILDGSRDTRTHQISRWALEFESQGDADSFVKIIEKDFKTIKVIFQKELNMYERFRNQCENIKNVPVDQGQEDNLLARRTGADQELRQPAPPVTLAEPKKRSSTGLETRGGQRFERIIKSTLPPERASQRLATSGRRSITKTLMADDSEDDFIPKANREGNDASNQEIVASFDRARRSTTRKREPTPVPIIRWSEHNDLGPEWTYDVVCPLDGKKKAHVQYEDLKRLDDGEYLNDNLIEFHMRYEKERHNSASNQVYVFGSHFYTQLRLGFSAVSRWTKDDDIFQYENILVPINESQHWYLAIITNVQNLLKNKDDWSRGENSVTVEDDDNVNLDTVSHTRPITADGTKGTLFDQVHAVLAQPEPLKEESDATAAPSVDKDGPDAARLGIDKMSLEDSVSTITNVKASMPRPDGTVAPESNQGVSNESPSGEAVKPTAASRTNIHLSKRSSRKAPPARKLPPNDPHVVIIDPMGMSRPASITCLKNYLVAEAKEKKNYDLNKQDIKGANLNKNIPQQDNFYDCGVFVCTYISKFMQNPKNFVRKLLGQEFDRTSDWPDMNALKMRDQMRETLLSEYERQEPIHKARKAERKKVHKQSRLKDQSKSEASKETAAADTGKIENESRSNSRSDGNVPDDVGAKAGLVDEFSQQAVLVPVAASIEAPDAAHSLENVVVTQTSFNANDMLSPRDIEPQQRDIESPPMTQDNSIPLVKTPILDGGAAAALATNRASTPKWKPSDVGRLSRSPRKIFNFTPLLARQSQIDGQVTSVTTTSADGVAAHVVHGEIRSAAEPEHISGNGITELVQRPTLSVDVTISPIDSNAVVGSADQNSLGSAGGSSEVNLLPIAPATSIPDHKDGRLTESEPVDLTIDEAGYEDLRSLDTAKGSRSNNVMHDRRTPPRQTRPVISSQMSPGLPSS